MGTALCHANSVFNTALASNESPASPTRRYAKRMTQLGESQNAEILRKELRECRELRQTRKKRTRDKRIKLQGELVFSRDEVYVRKDGHMGGQVSAQLKSGY
ncbi:hypothetical protein LIPSTDRAFT_69107 [Lipomyces starkeyi NRRL Y-11557]|uniref:Uncharacterized protein n=1 Tax=Lipomyces starkeyi NRRL Y-11557 TaxID=675824 RepID=A0A1E3QB90_LIPST|nr:hypothetical protein LIPSTDRAFT_69107 [Lipomyces starkeyi NRRL Y-11557]